MTPEAASGMHGEVRGIKDRMRRSSLFLPHQQQRATSINHYLYIQSTCTTVSTIQHR